MAKPFIGIKQLWYGSPLTSAQATGLTNAAAVASLIAAQDSGFTEIKNVHEGTWGYSQDDPSVTDYINELTGQPYYRDKTTLGNRTITFTIGVYDFATKAAMQGGSAISTDGWKSSGALQNVNKTIIAKTKTDNYIVFSNASIVAKGDQQEKNIGLGVTAVCMESDIEGVEAEYMFEGTTA